MGKVRAARELRGRGIDLSASAVRSIWKQHSLATSYDRLRRGRAALSESQRARLRRATISRRVTARAGAKGSAHHPRREELIAAAAKIFSARGYGGASLREICAAAGILAGLDVPPLPVEGRPLRQRACGGLSPPERGGRPRPRGQDRAVGPPRGGDRRAPDRAGRAHRRGRGHFRQLVPYGRYPAAAPPQPGALGVRRALPQAHPGAPAARRCGPQPAAPDAARRHQLDARLVPPGQAYAGADRDHLVQKVLRKGLG